MSLPAHFHPGSSLLAVQLVVTTILAAAATFTAAPAAAQSTRDVAAAEALFRDGRRLMDEENYTEACRKFEASLRLDAALGTLLNLANCYELDGLLASAWARFVEAESLARRDGEEARQRVARQRATALEPRLIRLRLKVSKPVEGLRVTVGGLEFTSAVWNTAIPIDPGIIEVTAAAPRHEPWSHSVAAEAEGKTLTVEVPALEPQAVRETPQDERAGDDARSDLLGALDAEAPGSARSRRPLRIAAFTAGGAGLVATGLGLWLGARARNRWDDANCPSAAGGGRLCATPADQTLAEEAKRSAHASTGMVVVGGALIGTAAALLIVSRKKSDPDGVGRVLVTPMAGRDGAGLSLGGSF